MNPWTFSSLCCPWQISFTPVTTPKMLAIFWFQNGGISYGSCLSQMFFLDFIFGAGSAILLAMAFNCYVAICYPLRYATILIPSITGKMGFASVIRSFFICFPLVLLVYRLTYCYCDPIFLIPGYGVYHHL